MSRACWRYGVRNSSTNRWPVEKTEGSLGEELLPRWLGWICELTRIQQVRVIVSQSFVGQKVVPVPVERQEGHHVVAIVVADGGVGARVAAPGGLVSPEPALVDAGGRREEDEEDGMDHRLRKKCVHTHLSMKAWWSRKMGSLAEPCTDDMEPFMKTCRALCMVLWPTTDKPVSGSAKPGVRKEPSAGE